MQRFQTLCQLMSDDVCQTINMQQSEFVKLQIQNIHAAAMLEARRKNKQTAANFTAMVFTFHTSYS